MRESFIQKAFNNIEIWRKLFIFNVAIICFVILVAAAALYNEYRDNQNDYHLVEQTIRNNYDTSIKNQIENVITLLDGVYKKYESGEITLEEARELGADLVRNLRYDGDGYFWVDTTEGLNVVLLGSSTEGTNRYNFRDANGSLVVKDFIELALKSGGGYLDYWFPKANQTQPLMKRG